MARSGSENRKRQIPLKARFDEAEAALVRKRAACAGITVAAYIRYVALGQKPLRNSRTPPLDRKLAAQLLGQLGVLATALRDATGDENAREAAVIDAVHHDLAELRTVLFEALGRRP